MIKLGLQIVFVFSSVVILYIHRKMRKFPKVWQMFGHKTDLNWLCIVPLVWKFNKLFKWFIDFVFFCLLPFAYSKLSGFYCFCPPTANYVSFSSLSLSFSFSLCIWEYKHTHTYVHCWWTVQHSKRCRRLGSNDQTTSTYIIGSGQYQKTKQIEAYIMEWKRERNEEEKKNNKTMCMRKKSRNKLRKEENWNEMESTEWKWNKY